MIPALFNRTAGEDIASQHGRAGLILANHVIAHVGDLDDFVSGISTLLSLDGVAVLEFQYAADLIVGNQFDHLYHEHRSFLSLTSLSAVTRRHGLHVADVERTTHQGGSLRVKLIRNTFTGQGKWVPGSQVRELYRSEEWLTKESSYDSLQDRIEHLRTMLWAMIGDQLWRGKTIAAYGASAKSTTLLNFLRLGPDVISYVEDLTPGERDRPDVYLLTVWNYLSEVLRREKDFLDGGGKFIVPIPFPVIL